MQLHINTRKLIPRLPKFPAIFLAAVSRVHSAKNTKQKKGSGKSRLISTLTFLGIFYFRYLRFLQKVELPEQTTDSQRYTKLCQFQLSVIKFQDAT